jgi:hypothetical protein
VVRLVLPPHVSETPLVRGLHRSRAEGFIAVDRDVPLLDGRAAPTLLLVEQGEMPPRGWLPTSVDGDADRRAPRIIVCWRDSPTPHHATATVADYHSPCVPIDLLTGAL